jgi:hypothetical protein
MLIVQFVVIQAKVGFVCLVQKYIAVDMFKDTWQNITIKPMELIQLSLAW